MNPDFSTPHIPAMGLAGRLNDEDRNLLSSYGTFHMAEVGTTLIHQNLPHGKLFFVISGLLHARRNDDDQEILLGPIRQGEWFGEVDLFQGGGAAGSVVVIEPTQYWTITREELEAYLQNYPQAGLQLLTGIIQVVSSRLRSITGKLTDKIELASIREELEGT